MTNNSKIHFELIQSLIIPSTIILDVRGTLIDPFIDQPINDSLANRLRDCQCKGINLLLITGCSIQTINTLILTPFRKTGCIAENSTKSNFNEKRKIIIYTGTGSQGYLVNTNDCLLTLPDFSYQTLDIMSKEGILDAIRKTCTKLNLQGIPEIRPNQVNFYCAYNRQDRLVIAEEIKRQLSLLNISNLTIIVPTAKMVIDISLSSKKQAFMDYQSRFRLKDFKQVILISDSLQIDGSDIELFECMPGAKAIHVGPIDKPLFPGVIHWEGGPQATEEILSFFLQKN